MRKLSIMLLSLLLSIVLLLTSVPVFSFDNEPDNFRGIKWGSNLKEISNMRVVENAGDMKFCKKKNDKLKIGPASITDLAYVFYKGKFMAVMIKFEGYSNYSYLKDSFQQLYGEGIKTNRFMEDYIWMGSSVDIMLDYHEIGDKGTVNYTYKPIADERKADKSKQTKTAIDDL